MTDLNSAQFGANKKAASKTIGALKKADPKKYWSVSKPGAGYQVHKLGDEGFVATKDNKHSVDVGGLVAKPGSSGVTRQAMAKVDHSFPEHPQTLDAFDGHLPKIYAKHGFVEKERMPFDPHYAPKEWDEKTHGRPDVVVMQRPAAQGSLFPHEYPTTPAPEEKAPEKKKKKKSQPNKKQGTLF